MEPEEPVLLVLLVRGDVTPTWVLMPLLQEPVCDTEGVFLPEPPLSDSSEMSEGFRRLHLEPGSILTPLSDPPSGLFTSSPDQAWCNAVEAECFSASVTGWEHTHTHTHRFITAEESVFYETLPSGSKKCSGLRPQPSCWVILPASTPPSPGQLVRKLLDHIRRSYTGCDAAPWCLSRSTAPSEMQHGSRVFKKKTCNTFKMPFSLPRHNDGDISSPLGVFIHW